MIGLMMESILAEGDGKPRPTLVDLGYTTDRHTKSRYDAVRALGIGKANFSIEGHGRLFVRIPPKKLETVMATLPIVPGETYYRATHHWRGLGSGERKARAPIMKGSKP